MFNKSVTTNKYSMAFANAELCLDSLMIAEQVDQTNGTSSYRVVATGVVFSKAGNLTEDNKLESVSTTLTMDSLSPTLTLGELADTIAASFSPAIVVNSAKKTQAVRKTKATKAQKS